MLKCSVKLLDEGRAGDNVGILLRGIKRDEVERGQVLAKKGTLLHILNLKLKFMYYQKKKVDVIHHFLMVSSSILF